MDILHKVNLHIFVEFQEYVARERDIDVYGKSIQDLTQEDIEHYADCEHVTLAQCELYSLWMCFRTAWISGASKPPEGHGESCYYCHQACDSLAANPGQWPVGLCHPDEPGKLKWHHTSCVSKRLLHKK